MVTMSAIAYSTLGGFGEQLRSFHREIPALNPVESAAKKPQRIDEPLTFSSMVKGAPQAVASEIPTAEQEVKSV